MLKRKLVDPLTVMPKTSPTICVPLTPPLTMVSMGCMMPPWKTAWPNVANGGGDATPLPLPPDWNWQRVNGGRWKRYRRQSREGGKGGHIITHYPGRFTIMYRTWFNFQSGNEAIQLFTGTLLLLSTITAIE